MECSPSSPWRLGRLSAAGSATASRCAAESALDGACLPRSFSLLFPAREVHRPEFVYSLLPSGKALGRRVTPQSPKDNAKVGVQPTLQRTAAAFLAISLRLSAESRSARTFPPLLPPSLPSATAAGFFFRLIFGEGWPVEVATILAAIWFVSSRRLLERLGMILLLHRRLGGRHSRFSN